MYRIPENIDAIKNEIINQIAFGVNVITLFFSKGFIQFSGCFVFLYDGQKFEQDEVYPVQHDHGLLQLLEKRITSIIVNNERNILTLEFEGRFVLKLIGSENYESYVLNINGEEVIV
jgi:hypothetical protein